MRGLIFLLMILSLISCGYNIQSDREVADRRYEIERIKEELEISKDQYELLKDSLKVEELKITRLKDSIEFINQTRIMCYQSGSHRHSCEIYGNQLLTATKVYTRENPIESSNETSEIASIE